MKCQLEMIVEYFNSTIGISLPLIPQMANRTPSITSSTNSMQIRQSQTITDLRKRCTYWKNINDDDQHSDLKPEQEFDLCELPFLWSWQNRELLEKKTDETSEVYSIVDKTDSNKTVDIRIYSTEMSNRTSRLRFQRHRIALERLKGKIISIKFLIKSFYDHFRTGWNTKSDRL